MQQVALEPFVFTDRDYYGLSLNASVGVSHLHAVVGREPCSGVHGIEGEDCLIKED